MKNLTQVLLEWSDTKFSYNGRGDCCAFAGEVVRAIHGYDPMDTFTYTTKASAIEAIRARGGLVEAVTATLGPPLPVEGAEDGDVLAAMQEDGEWIVGVALGGRMAVKTKKSLMDWPLEFALHRWRPQCQPQ
jgi:Domain of unknown function (DUF6950)